MLFWIAVAVLTFGACLAVLVPFLRAAPRPGSNPTRDDGAHDLEVYRDQLSEIDRDEARRLIAPEEAAQARTEIARRMLLLEQVRDGDGARAEDRRGFGQRVAVTAAVLALPIASWGTYIATGSPGEPAQPLQARLEKNPSESSVDELVARAESHLATNPQDGRGWDVLGPIYLRLGRFGEAATAFQNAIRLEGETAPRRLGLGEAIAGAAGGTITLEAQTAFERALELEPGMPRARFLLALGIAQEGRTEEAAGEWRAMLEDLPADSPWRGPIQQELAGLGETDGARSAQADQLAMIEDMVAGLDRRLRDDPDDPEGWQRLVQSYVVLGRADAARDALDRGVEALGAGSPAAVELAAFANSRGIGLDGGGK